MRNNALLNGFLMLLIAVGSLGCVAAAVGGASASAVAYVRGELEVQVEYAYEDVVAATEDAIADLQFVQEDLNKDALRATFDARNADDKSVSVRIERLAEKLTTVKIRIGVFGDQQQSQLVLDKIKANL